MDRFQYLLLMAACLVGTLPLEFVFHARVYRQPLRLIRTLWLPVLVFMVWDAVAVERGHWWFADRYVTGWEVAADVPLEELVFFMVIPICALLSLESCRWLLGRLGRLSGRRLLS